MPALTRILYPLPPAQRTWWAQLNWWESRRLIYNVIVGSTGLVTLGTFVLFTRLPPHAVSGWIPWQPIVVYGLLANVAYTLGFATERVLAWLWKGDSQPAPDAGPVLFRQGVLFSVGLTLLPIGLAVISWLARVVQLFL